MKLFFVLWSETVCRVAEKQVQQRVAHNKEHKIIIIKYVVEWDTNLLFKTKSFSMSHQHYARMHAQFKERG